MSKDFFKYNQNNKEKLQKKLVKDMKVFLKQKKNNDNMFVNTKNYQKLKNKSLLSKEKDIRK